jgi:hypothetical protein
VSLKNTLALVFSATVFLPNKMSESMVEISMCAFYQAYQMINADYIKELMTPQFPGTGGEGFVSNQYDMEKTSFLHSTPCV